MQTSGLPARMPTPFADSGAKQTIPVASQIGVANGRASYTDGFPPLTRTPIVAGGIPPFGTDFNGILNSITAAVRWNNAGGMYAYDATFSTAVSGYPKGAFIAKSGYNGYWQNTVEGNTTNPDSGGAGWLDPLSGRLLRVSVYARVGGVQMVSVNGGAFTTTGASTFTPAPGALSYIAEAVGGGGGSGGTSATGASQWSLTGGGSGGVYGRRLDVIPASPQAVTVGSGGVAGGIGTNGGSGSATSLSSLLSVGGGSGSASNAATSGNSVYGGSTTTLAASGANIFSSNGGYGTYGISLNLFISGTGGSSYFGPGGPPVLSTNPGQSGISPGSGAGGACTTPSSAGQVGGKGADGLLVIYEYA